MPARKTSRPSPAQALLDAHVAFLLDALRGPEPSPLLTQWLDLLLSQVGSLPLEQIVARETVAAAARTYAAEWAPGEGLPPLVAALVRHLQAQPVLAHTRLGDLLSSARFETLLGHALSLKAVRRRLVRGFLASPLYERIASELLYHGIRDYLGRNASAAQQLPGARSALKLGRAVVGLAGGGIERAVEDGLKQHIARSVGAVSQKAAQPLLDGAHDEAIHAVLAGTWRAQLAPLTVAELRDDLGAAQVEDLAATLYGAGEELRRTPFLAQLAEAAVDGFFARYAQVSAQALLVDLGIDRDLLLAELQRFAPGVLQRLDAQGRLEALLRGLLAPFYASGRVEAVLRSSD